MVGLSLVACSTSSHPAAAPTGPAAQLTGPITVGTIQEPSVIIPINLAADGYVEQEFFASGSASSFAAAGPLGGDGRWSVTPQGSAPYRTRIVVRRPSDPKRFSGTVVAEWLNVSGGVEAAPDWTYLSDEIMREGDAYVGLSAQAFGVVGGKALLSAPGAPPAGGLRSAEPARYGSLVHPGDQYSYDMLSQVGRALRSGGPVLGGVTPKRVIADGESQSAFYLTTYIDAIQPVSHVFDGFFVHSRGGSGAPLGGGSIASSSGPVGARIRDDLTVPVFVFETQTDVGPLLNYSPARQPNTARLRVWEVAGTAHADAFLVGAFATKLGCSGLVNDGPQHYVEVAAFHAFDAWLLHGTAPPTAAPLQLSSTDPPTVATDALGNALGGVRTPAVDVPISTLSGAPAPKATTLCSLFGSTTPFTAATLVRLYHDKAGYLAAYQKALDRAIAAGFLLPADRAQLLSQAGQVSFAS